MNNTLNKLFIFAAGAAVGSVVTWKLVKTKYEQIANEEIESVKEVFGRGRRAEAKPVDDAAIVEEDDAPEAHYNGKTKNDCATLEEYQELLKSEGYREYLNSNEEEENKDRKERDIMNEPYVITPETFEEDEDHDVETLLYFADGVLTDEHNNPIEDVESLVGEESLTHFGDYPDDPDTVYVRNEQTMTDYEILADDRKFGEIYS